MKKPKPKSLMREVAYDRFKAELFKRNLTPGQFVSQGELCELLDAALQVDWGMHDLIVEAVGNRIMMTAHRQNFDKIRMIRLHGRSPRYIPLALDEHMAVIRALKRRDADQAAVALETHLKAAERRALGL